VCKLQRKFHSIQFQHLAVISHFAADIAHFRRLYKGSVGWGVAVETFLGMTGSVVFGLVVTIGKEVGKWTGMFRLTRNRTNLGEIE